MFKLRIKIEQKGWQENLDQEEYILMVTVLNQAHHLEVTDNQEMGEKAVKVIADFTVKPLVLMLVWNMTLPTFGIATITYFGAVGLYVIARILFKHD